MSLRMAPTVQRPGGGAGGTHKPSRQGDVEERKDLICRVRDFYVICSVWFGLKPLNDD